MRAGALTAFANALCSTNSQGKTEAGPEGLDYEFMVNTALPHAYVGRLWSDPSTARQLAYFEGYQAALAAAPTHELNDAAGRHWRDDLMACVDDCVAIFRSKRTSELRQDADMTRLRAVPQ